MRAADVSTDEALGVFGRRVDARKLTKEMYRELFEGQYPVVLTNVFAPASDTAAFNDAWCSEMLELLSAEEIEYDYRQNSNSSIEGFETTLADFVEALGDQSDHEESMYLMNEDILQVPEAEGLVQRLALPEPLFGQDLFEHFPRLIRPLTALIIGGAGARSFLHADPYEWVGWNYLLEGQKIWNFLPPSVPMEMLGARRNPPEAWGDFNISAGWVSDDVDLYKHIGLGPSAPEKTVFNDYLVRSYEALVAASQRTGGGIIKKKQLTTALEAVSKPLCFFSGNEAVDSGLDTSRCVQIIQREGEMVLIPPRWWHQVYHMEPSVAVAGQYFNDHGKAKVFRHILAWCGSGSGKGEAEIAEVLLRELPRVERDRDQVLRVIELGLEWSQGPRGGKDLFDRLVRESKEME